MWSKKRIDLDKKQLEKLYNNPNIAVKEIAKIFGVSRWTIKRRAKEYGLKLREQRFQKGKENYKWKDKIGYKGIHKWLRDNYPIPDKCENCGKSNKPLELACKNGIHKRDINNYQWLCHRCHLFKDGVMEKLWKGHNWLGKKHTKETKEKMSKSQKERQKRIRENAKL